MSRPKSDRPPPSVHPGPLLARLGSLVRPDVLWATEVPHSQSALDGSPLRTLLRLEERLSRQCNGGDAPLIRGRPSADPSKEQMANVKEDMLVTEKELVPLHSHRLIGA